ncbi:hypothetical protein Bca4012_039890 [Brassica carinata]
MRDRSISLCFSSDINSLESLYLFSFYGSTTGQNTCLRFSTVTLTWRRSSHAWIHWRRLSPRIQIQRDRPYHQSVPYSERLQCACMFDPRYFDVVRNVTISVGMKGTIANAKEILANTSNGYVLQQFESVVMPKIHYATTGPGIRKVHRCKEVSQ